MAICFKCGKPVYFGVFYHCFALYTVQFHVSDMFVSCTLGSVCPQNRFTLITLPPLGKAKYCDDRVYLSLSLSVFVLEGVCNCTSDLHSSQKFLYMLPMAVARSSSASVAIRYAFPVLWMTSYLHIMGICTSEVPVRTAGQPDGTASLGQWPGRLCLRTAAESAVGP